MRIIAGDLKGQRLVAPRGWKVRPTSDRVREATFSALGERALVEGTIEKRTDSHITRTPLALDEQGWHELSTLLNDVLEQASTIQGEAASRLSKDKGESINTMMAILHFERPSES